MGFLASVERADHHDVSSPDEYHHHYPGAVHYDDGTPIDHPAVNHYHGGRPADAGRSRNDACEPRGSASRSPGRGASHSQRHHATLIVAAVGSILLGLGILAMAFPLLLVISGAVLAGCAFLGVFLDFTEWS